MLKVPQRLFSFTDWMKSRPREPIPGDRLDMQFSELINAISATQRAIADIRADDGKLKRGIVSSDQLIPDLCDRLITSITGLLEPIRSSIRGSYTATIASEHQAELYAADAEAAARVAAQLTAGMDAIRKQAQQFADYVSLASTSASADATDAQNWGDYAQAQADNASLAANLSLQWAEYLAGPVVDATQAPAYISGTPFPHGLYYQPVEGGLAGLWSAKWWALYAQQLVGKGAFYYLGAWTSPPVPGAINPSTGQRVPSPLSPGSLYYDLTTNTLYVWNGSTWGQQQLLTAAYAATYLYIATAGQKVFSGPDSNGQTPVVGISPSFIYVNGTRLTASDYGINAASSVLTINDPLPSGATVQWDLLVPSSQLAPGSVTAFKVINLVPDGIKVSFPIQYIDPNSGLTTDAVVTSSTELMVCQDGVQQEPGGDYVTATTGTTSTLTMQVAPPADSHFWAVWYKSA